MIDNAKLMLERHNEVVSNDDIVLMVGDLSASLRGRENHFKELLKLLNGKKILIRGNHDYQPNEFYKEAGFIDVVDYISIPPYFINHYPCFISKYTKSKEKDMIKLVDNSVIHTIIHGHIHNKAPFESDGFKRINVCVDYEPNNFYPIQLLEPEIIEYFNKNIS